MTLKEFWALALSARLFPLSIERGTKSPIGLWRDLARPFPEPHPDASAVGLRCLPGDGYSGIDVDCDCGQSGRYLDIMRRELRAIPVRFGRPGRFLVPFWCEGAVAGRSLPLPCGCRVQIISGQFVAWGTHPETQQPYRWEDFAAPWPSLNQIGLYALLSYIGVNATSETKEYMSELDLAAEAPQNDAERVAVVNFVNDRLNALTEEIRGRTEGRGIPIFNATAAIAPAVRWGLVPIETVYRAIEAAGQHLQDKRGGRTLGEEVVRAMDDGVLTSNALLHRVREYKKFLKQSMGNSLTIGANTLDILDEQQFAPLKFVIDDILPQGFVIFAAKPKLGKSFIVLEAALSVIEGGTFWGRNCVQGDVLIYSFEDTHQRMQTRYRALRPNGVRNKERFLYFTGDSGVPRVSMVPGQPCFTQHLERELQKRPDTRLVVIDPIIAIRADQRDKNKSLYQVDYDNIKAVQQVAGKYGVTIIGVHHVNKKSDVTDAADMVSGSTGMTAAADGSWVMHPDKERQNAELETQMRDTTSEQFFLAKHLVTSKEGKKVGIKWEPVDGAPGVAKSASETERSIIAAIIAAGCEATAMDIMQRCPTVNVNTLRVYLRRMAGVDKAMIEHTARGLYVATGMKPKSRPEGARDILVNAANGGKYSEYQTGKVVDVKHVMPHLRNNDKAPVHEGYAVSVDSARALLSAFHEPGKLIQDMESRKLAFIFDKVLLIPATVHGTNTSVQVAAAPERPLPWTLAGMMLQQQKGKLPWE